MENIQEQIQNFIIFGKLFTSFFKVLATVSSSLAKHQQPVSLHHNPGTKHRCLTYKLSQCTPHYNLITCRTHLNDNTRTTDNFSGLACAVNLAETCPFTKLLVIVHLDQWDLVFIAQSLYQFLVHRFIAVFC